MTHRIRLLLVAVLAFASLGALCEPQIESAEISRERAIEIARQEIKGTADSVEAIRATSEGPERQAVWRVTFTRRLPDALPGLFETHIFEIDVRTGRIVGVSTS